MTKIAINGFGRIGRPTFRLALKSKDLEVVAINDLADSETLAHLLKYDSIYGTYEASVSHDNDHIIVDDKKFRVYAESDPSNLDWKKLGVDIVLECTGRFTTKELAEKHINAGAKKVVLSAPPKSDDIPIFILGVNEEKFDPQNDFIISNGSCTTNCLAPVLKVLNDNFGIKHSFATTIHAYTNAQRLIDLPHKDLRRARAAAQNIIPTSTGAAKAVCAAIPSLKGKFTAAAVRVPVPIISIIDLVCVLEKSVTVDKINNTFKKLSRNKLRGILTTTNNPLVSSDFIGSSHSAVVDLGLTSVQGNLIKVAVWYDNEYAYACRLVEMTEYIAKKNF